MKNLIYTSMKQWRLSLRYRLGMFLKGIYGLLVHCLIIGMVSVIYYVMRQVNAFFRRETIAGCIVTFLLALLTMGWITTFVKERHLRVEAQHRADSLAYDLSKFTQMYDSTEIIVINGDTIRSR